MRRIVCEVRTPTGVKIGTAVLLEETRKVIIELDADYFGEMSDVLECGMARSIYVRPNIDAAIQVTHAPMHHREPESENS